MVSRSLAANSLSIIKAASDQKEDQRKAAANNSDRNLNRKRICDADGVAKNVDQPFHVVSPGEVEREAQLNLRAACQKVWQQLTTTNGRRLPRALISVIGT